MMLKKPRTPNTVMHKGKRMVCRIFDAGITATDRYTVAFKGYYLANHGMVYPYLASSERPLHPWGVGLHCESKTYLTGRHLGKRVRFEDCPPQVKQFIHQQWEP